MHFRLPPFWSYDIFISYRWKSAKQYATKLALLLEKRGGLRCYVDSALEAGGNIGRIERQVTRSRMIVLIATPDLPESEYIKGEISKFIESHKKALERHETCLVPIHIDNAFFAGPLASAIRDGKEPWTILQNKNRVEESLEALSAGEPSDHVAQMIDVAFAYTRTKVKWSRSLFATAMLFFIIACSALLGLFRIQTLRDEARNRLKNYNASLYEKQVQIDTSNKTISRQKSDVRTLKEEKEGLDAQVETINGQRITAETAREKAIRLATTAQKEAKFQGARALAEVARASLEKGRANKEQNRADREKGIADVRARTNRARMVLTRDNDPASSLALSLDSLVDIHRLGLIEPEAIRTFMSAYVLSPIPHGKLTVPGVYQGVQSSYDRSQIAIAVRPGRELTSTIVVVDIKTRRKLAEVTQEGLFPSVAVAPRSGRLYVGTPLTNGKGVLNVWDIATSKRVIDPILVDGQINALTISPDEQYVAWVVGGIDTYVVKAKEIGRVEAEPIKVGRPLDLAFSANGQSLYLIGRDSATLLGLGINGWSELALLPSPNVELERQRLPYHGRWSIGKHSSRLAVRTANHVVVWSQLPNFKWTVEALAAEKRIHSIQISNDGNQVAALTFDNQVLLWANKLNRFELQASTVFRQESSSGGINLEFDDSGRTLSVAGGFTGEATSYDPFTLRTMFRYKGTDPVYRVLPTSDQGEHAVVTSSRDATNIVWLSSDTTSHNPGAVRSIAFSQNGTWVATGTGGTDSPAVLTVKELKGGMAHRLIGGGHIDSIAFGSSDRLLAVIRDGQVIVWKLKDGSLAERLSTLDLERMNVNRINFIGQTSTVLLSSGPGGDSTAYMYETANGNDKPRILGTGILETALSDNGDIVLGLRTGEVRVYQVGKKPFDITTGISPTGLSLSQNGILALSGFRSGSQHRTLEIWDLNRKTRAIMSVEGERPKISPDGSKVVLTTFDGFAHVIDIESGVPIAPLALPDPISTIAWSKNGQLGLGSLTGTFAVVPYDPLGLLSLGRLRLRGNQSGNDKGFPSISRVPTPYYQRSK